jgi:hypothetical protein
MSAVGIARAASARAYYDTNALQGQAPPQLRLLTFAFAGGLHGDIHRVILLEDSVIYGWTGRKQAGYDGGAFSVDLPVEPMGSSPSP